MPTQRNFEGPKPPMKPAAARATVTQAQVNFSYGEKKRSPGKSNRSKPPVQFSGRQGVPNATLPRSFFGEKSGTGNNGGY